MASPSIVLALVMVLAASAGSQQLGLLSPTSIAVNNPGELGLVSPQQAAAAAAAAATLQQHTQNGQHLYPALYTPYSYYPAPLLQQSGLASDLQSQLLQNTYQLNHAGALGQQQQHPQSPFVPGYAYLIANNPYQMVGSSVGHHPLQSYDSRQLTFNDLYHQGYVSPDHVSQILGTQTPNFHQQQYHQHFPHQHHSQETGQYHRDGNIVEPSPLPQREAQEQEHQHHSTTTTTPAPTTRPPTFRTFQGKDYRANPSRRPPNRRQPKPNRTVDSSTTRSPPTKTAYTNTYNPYVFRHDSPTRRTFYDHENNTQNEIKPIITSTIATPINQEITTTQKPEIPYEEERKIYIRHTTRTPEYLNSEKIRNSAPKDSDDHHLVDGAWSGGKSFTSAREHTPPPLPTAFHEVPDVPSINSQSYEAIASISSDDPFYFEAITNFDHTGYYVPPPRSPPHNRLLPEYLPYSPLRDRYRPAHVADHHDQARYQPYWNPASQTDEVFFDLDPHLDYNGLPPNHSGEGGDESDDYDHSKERELSSLYDIHSPTYKEGYGETTYKPTLSQDSLDKIYHQSQPKSIFNHFVTPILPSDENHNTENVEPVRITTPISNFRDASQSINHNHESITQSPVRPTLQQTPLIVSSFSTTPPSHVVEEPTTVRQYATAWPITPPPSYSPDRSKRPFRVTSQLPEIHKQKLHLNEQGRKVIEIQPEFRDNYRRRQQTRPPLPPQLRPHVGHYEQYYNGKTLDDPVSPEVHLPVEQGLPIPPNIPLVYHPNVFEQNIHNHGRHGASILPLPYGQRQRARNYKAPDLEGPGNDQTGYNLPNESSLRHEDTKITVGSKEYGKSNYDTRNDTGTRSGVYFSPFVTLAPPTTPHTYRAEYDDRKHNSQESHFSNAISRQPASNFRSYSASPLPEIDDHPSLIGYNSDTDFDEKRVPQVHSLPHRYSSPTQRPYEAPLSTSAIYHAPPPHMPSKLIPVPVNSNEVGSKPYQSRAKNSNDDHDLVFEDVQYYSPYARPKIEPYHQPIPSSPYYQHEPKVAQYHQPRIQNYGDDPNVLASPYYAARTLKFSGPNEALNQDAVFLPQRGLGRGRLRRRRRPLWMRLAGRIEQEDEFKYHPVVHEAATDAANELSYHQVVQGGATDAANELSYHQVVQGGATDAANELSYHQVVQGGATDAANELSYQPEIQGGAIDAANELSYPHVIQRGATEAAILNYDVPPTPPSSPRRVSDQTYTRTRTPYAAPSTPPRPGRESNARPVIDLNRSESQGVRELRHTDAISNVASEEQENGLQQYEPDEPFEFPSPDNAPGTDGTAKKRRRKQYKHTTPKTAKPRTAAEVKRSHLRQHQQLLQNTKLQPPERKEAWKAKRRTTTTMTSLKNKYAEKRGRGVPSENEDVKEKNKGEENVSIENQEESKKSAQNFTPRRQTQVSQDMVRRPQPTRRRSTTTAPPPTPQENTTLSTGYSLEHLYAPFLKQLQDWDAKNGK